MEVEKPSRIPDPMTKCDTCGAVYRLSMEEDHQTICQSSHAWANVKCLRCGGIFPVGAGTEKHVCEIVVPPKKEQCAADIEEADRKFEECREESVADVAARALQSEHHQDVMGQVEKDIESGGGIPLLTEQHLAQVLAQVQTRVQVGAVDSKLNRGTWVPVTSVCGPSYLHGQVIRHLLRSTMCQQDARRDCLMDALAYALFCVLWYDCEQSTQP